MMLRRGFKAEANEYARELRAELDLRSWSPLCPWALAKHLAIPVIRLSSLQGKARMEVAYLLRNGRDYFSAVTVFDGYRRAILHNDGNAKTRQTADIAHELAHAILGHPPEQVFGHNTARQVNRRAEAEASWLGPALLISDEAAVLIARARRSLSEAAAEYGVSESLLRMRLNVTGARRRAQRRRQDGR
jgi:Zn-dependent peptidase ImmA (M78 family)